MQYCTACQKAIATVFILDLREGTVVGQHHLCQSCAEVQGVVQAKTSPLKLPPELLEDLFGSGPKPAPDPKRKGPKEGPACPACKLTAAEFKTRGRLGCARCYTVFRAALMPLLERVHDATSHRGRCLTRIAATSASPDALADLQRRLNAAIGAEKYEEAAQLRDEIRRAETRARSTAPKGQDSAGELTS